MPNRSPKFTALASLRSSLETSSRPVRPRAVISWMSRPSANARSILSSPEVLAAILSSICE
jgi:hypothetical protein